MPNLDAYLHTSLGLTIILILAALVTVAINILPVIAYPSKLFFTLIHELGHVFATRLSRGEVVGFFVFANDSGVAINRGGDRLLIILAGYLGTSLFSAALLVLGGLPETARYTLGAVGGILIFAVLLYGTRSLLTVAVGLFFGLSFIGVAWYLQLAWSVLLINILAFQGSFISLRHLHQLSRNLSGDDDASKMAQQLGCSPLFWARTWFVFSIVLLGGAFWFTLTRIWLS